MNTLEYFTPAPAEPVLLSWVEPACGPARRKLLRRRELYRGLRRFALVLGVIYVAMLLPIPLLGAGIYPVCWTASFGLAIALIVALCGACARLSIIKRETIKAVSIRVGEVKANAHVVLTPTELDVVLIEVDERGRRYLVSVSREVCLAVDPGVEHSALEQAWGAPLATRAAGATGVRRASLRV